MRFAGLPVPKTGTALYSVTASDDTGDTAAQFGAKYQDGNLVGFFVFDLSEGTQQNIQGAPEASGGTLTATVDNDNLGSLAGVSIATWSAAYTLNGHDVAVCPSSGDSLPLPG